jgi:hypothetical protein
LLGDKVICQGRSIDAADGAIDGMGHAPIHRFDIELIFLAAVADDLQIHRILFVKPAENYSDSNSKKSNLSRSFSAIVNGRIRDRLAAVRFQIY